MIITVGPEDPHHPEATALLRASHALMEELFPPESNHYLSIDALVEPHIQFFAAKDKSGKILGCGALANKGSYGEVKSMFVDTAARGQGVAQSILSHIEAQAIAAGLPKLMLETGYLLKAAHRLYYAAGFQKCGAFGDYPTDDANSIFMEKLL